KNGTLGAKPVVAKLLSTFITIMFWREGNARFM
ncbi:unnamed protein product, partial [marine sediment metagenome]